MKYCDNCKLNIDSQHQRCPLCGGIITEQIEETSRQHFFAEMQNATARPTLKLNKMTNRYKSKVINTVVVSIVLLCAIVNLIFTPNIRFVGYCMLTSLFFTDNRLTRMLNKGNVANKTVATVILFALTAIVCEISAKDTFNPDISIFAILPCISILALLTIDIAFVFGRNNCKGLYKALLVCTVLCLIPQTIRWLNNTATLSKFATLTALLLFVNALTNLATIKILFYRYIKNEKSAMLRI